MAYKPDVEQCTKKNTNTSKALTLALVAMGEEVKWLFKVKNLRSPISCTYFSMSAEDKGDEMCCLI